MKFLSYNKERPFIIIAYSFEEFLRVAAKKLGMIVRGDYFYSDIIDSSWYVYVGEDSVYLGNRISQFNDIGLPLEFDHDAKDFYMTFGFICPPFTLFRNVFRLAAFVGMKLGKRGITFSSFYPKQVARTNLDLSEELEDFARYKLSPAQKGPIAIAFSGGVDSALLLSAFTKVIGSEKVIAITCAMTGYEHELTRARTIAKQLGVKLFVNDCDFDATSILDKYIIETLEPVCDEIVPVIYNLVLQARQKEQSFSIIVDGQGADSLLMGLPHDKLVDLHLRSSRLVRPILKCFNIKPCERGHTRLGRLNYRLNKILYSLQSPGPLDAIVASLMTGSEISDSNSVLQFIRSEIKTVANRYRSNHMALRYLFLFRILPAREMQKYYLIRKVGIKVLMPFLERDLIERVFSMEDSFFIRGHCYKWPVYAAASKYYGKMFKKVKTSPFYVKYCLHDAQHDSSIMKYSLDIIQRTIE